MMEARFRSWWQKIKTHPVAAVMITVVIVLVTLVILGDTSFIGIELGSMVTTNRVKRCGTGCNSSF
jgi:hypothetical protein